MAYPIKSFFYLIIITAFIVSCSNSGKQYFTDEVSDFKILFPGKPTTSERTIVFPFGSFSGKKFSMETTTGLNTSYSVTCIELPANIVHSDSMNLLSQLFAITQADYLQQFGEGGLINTWVKSVNKYPGREYVWADIRNNKGYTRRVFYVEDKLYLLEIGYNTSNQHNVEINEFLDSFQLLSKEINPNPEPEPSIPVKKFVIDFPGATETRRMVIQGTTGPTYIVTEMYKPNSGRRFDEFGNFAYGVNYIDFQKEEILKMPEDLQRNFIYENAVNSPMIQNGGRIISNLESTINGNWCIETKALILNGQIEFTAKSFFKNKYLYQVLVLSAVTKGDNPTSKEFMESFRLK
ncbi:hypothetical protein [Fluviicola taffensis]|uniref:hypothetical protein n=1 Tax=Fluviicola taffensis TaxID=191579 RepID=UPI0031376F6C